MAQTAEYWRDRAKKARAKADAMRDAECKQIMLDIAEAYEKLGSLESQGPDPKPETKPLAKNLRKQSRALACSLAGGNCCCLDPFSGEGYGAEGFTWSGLIVDRIERRRNELDRPSLPERGAGRAPPRCPECN